MLELLLDMLEELCDIVLVLCVCVDLLDDMCYCFVGVGLGGFCECELVC